MRYVVIDRDGHVSFYAGEKSSDRDGPESFDGLDAALARAKELAALAPGDAIRIYKAITCVIVPIAPVEVRDIQD